MIPRVKAPQTYNGIRTVFLDRDGVLNRKAPEGEYVSRWDLFHPLPGVEEAVRLLNQAGLKVYVATNQRGVALGLYTTADVERLHTRLNQELAAHGAHIDGFFYCPHDKGVCECRKPEPGLFEQARALHPEICWETSVMIGDSLSDIEVGVQLGMRTVFIEGDRATQKAGAEKATSLGGAVSGSLLEIARLITASKPACEPGH